MSSVPAANQLRLTKKEIGKDYEGKNSLAPFKIPSKSRDRLSENYDENYDFTHAQKICRENRIELPIISDKREHNGAVKTVETSGNG